jgi:hypothetical protein
MFLILLERLIPEFPDASSIINIIIHHNYFQNGPNFLRTTAEIIILKWTNAITVTAGLVRMEL